uniref:Putative leucine-rich repeat receptor-like serine/threonine-protein kinase At5g15730 isoform X1 n=1 Tax=Rhizophora mucronata TaxID=61149 RepID=A0A2P2NLS8_RHIMU
MIPHRRLTTFLRVFWSLGDCIRKRCTEICGCIQAIYTYRKSHGTAYICTLLEVSTPLTPPYARKYQ